jgi:hypothetical protein
MPLLGARGPSHSLCRGCGINKAAVTQAVLKSSGELRAARGLEAHVRTPALAVLGTAGEATATSGARELAHPQHVKPRREIKLRHRLRKRPLPSF